MAHSSERSLWLGQWAENGRIQSYKRLPGGINLLHLNSRRAFLAATRPGSGHRLVGGVLYIESLLRWTIVEHGRLPGRVTLKSSRTMTMHNPAGQTFCAPAWITQPATSSGRDESCRIISPTRRHPRLYGQTGIQPIPRHGLIGGVMQISPIPVDIPRILRWYAGEICILRRSRNRYRAISLCFLDGFFGPFTRIDVVCAFLAAQQIHRDHGKLAGSAAGEKKNLIVTWDTRQFPEISFGLCRDRQNSFAAWLIPATDIRPGQSTISSRACRNTSAGSTAGPALKL